MKILKSEGIMPALAVAALFLAAAASGADKPPKSSEFVKIPIPNGAKGIGFDDLGFARGIRRVIVPGGRMGSIFLIDPASWDVTSISGFSAALPPRRGHNDSVTSADEGAGLLFGIDRTTKLLYAADPAAGKFVAETALSSPPDYVRFVAPIGEVWVTEPRSHRIERFSVGTGDHVSLSKMGFIDVPGGPESLVVDAKRGRAYTNLWTDHTLAIDLSSAAVVASWPNTCAGSRGLAMDEERGYVLVGCEEGKAIALDAGNDGKIAGRFGFGSGVDIIGFNPVLRHLYLPGAQSATLAVILVRNDGLLLKLGEFPTVADAHCVTSDDLGQIWICDPDHGQILMMKDGYRGSGDK